MSKKKRRVLGIKKKKRKSKSRRPRKREEEQFLMFDSTKGSTESLFMAGVDLAKENIISFANFKNDDSQKLEEELKEFGIKFCGYLPSVIQNALPEPLKNFQEAKRDLFLPILICLITTGLFFVIFDTFVLPQAPMFLKDTIVSISRNSRDLKAGLPSVPAQNFAAALSDSVDIFLTSLKNIFPK